VQCHFTCHQSRGTLALRETVKNLRVMGEPDNSTDVLVFHLIVGAQQKETYRRAALIPGKTVLCTGAY